MKKAVTLFAAVFLFFSIFTCDAFPKETDMEYMVAALGFDENLNGVTAVAEIVIVNSDSKSDTSDKRIFKGEGTSVENALYDLNSSLSKPLMLGHCGLLALGENLDYDTVCEIWEYCFHNNFLTPATEVISAENAESLLKTEPVSAAAMGYEIRTALKQNSEYTGIKCRNRYYEIENLRLEKINRYSLPFIKKQDGNTVIDGLNIYFNDEIYCRADEKSAPYYAMLCGDCKGGKIRLGNCVKDIAIKNTRYYFNAENHRLKIEIKIKTDLENREKTILQDALSKFLKQEKDIFGLLGQIYRKDRKLFEKVNNNWNEIFSNAEITVRSI